MKNEDFTRISNAERAKDAADNAVASYARRQARYGRVDTTWTIEDVQDLMTDLMHLVQHEHQHDAATDDVRTIIRRAYTNFVAEWQEEHPHVPHTKEADL